MLNTVEDATLLTKRDQLMMTSWLPAQKMIFLYTPRARGWYQHLNFDVILGVRHFKEVSLTRFSS